MPRMKLQSVVFTAMMVFVMAFSISLYNIADNSGKLKRTMLWSTLGSMWLPYFVAVSYELTIAKPLAVKLAFRFVDPCGRPLFKILAMAIAMVTTMCSAMSLFITFMGYGMKGNCLSDGFPYLLKTICLPCACNYLSPGHWCGFCSVRFFRKIRSQRLQSA